MKKVLRPGGLTVLAICNLIFGGIQALGAFFSFVSLGCTVQIQGIEQDIAGTYRVFSLLLQTIIAVTLIISGAGTLKVKNLSGRWFANAYVVAAVLRIVIRFMWGNRGPDSFSMFTIIGLLYPLLVILFYNLVFRDVWKGVYLGKNDRKPKKTPDAGRNKTPHVLLIAGQSTRQVLRSPAGVILCFIIMCVGLMTAQVLLFPVDFLGRNSSRMGIEMDQNRAVDQIEETIVPLMTRILQRVMEEEIPEDQQGLLPLFMQQQFMEAPSGDPSGPVDAEKWSYFLIRKRPAFLSLLFLIFCLLLPAVFVFSGFNQISSDTRNRGLRFILMRTTRDNIFIGKMIASIAVTFILLVLLFLSILVYIRIKLDIYALYTMLKWGLRGLLGFTAVAIPYIALSITFSGMINSGAGSLGASLGTLLIVPLLGRLFASIWPPLRFIHFLMPYKISFFLFHPSAHVVFLTVLALLGYGAIYGGLGLLYFRRRDV